MKPKSTLRSFLLAAGSSLLAISYSHAADGTWDTNSGGDWTDVTKWLGDTNSASGADFTATFGNFISADSIINLNAAITIGNITASDTDKNYTISGANILTLDVTTGIPTIDVTTSSRTLTISSQISGNDGLRKTGAGSLVLSNASNNYSGGTVINGGTLTANAAAYLGAATGGITFSGNSTLAMTGTITHTRQITLDSNVTATILSGAGIDYNNSAKVTGAGNLRFTLTGNGGRNLRFNSTANDFTGTVSVENTSGQQLAVFFNSLVDSASSGAGNIIMTMSGANGPNTFAYGSGAIAPLTLTNRRLEITANTGNINAIFSNQNTTQAVTLNSNLLISGTGNKGLTLDAVAGPNNAFAGEIDNGSFSAATQVVSITKTGAGNWALSSASNGFTGTIAVNAGTLSYASAGGANPITFSNTTGAATLSYTGSTDKTMSGAINASTVTSGTVTLGSTGSGAVNYSNTGSLGTAGSGNKKLILTGTNTGNNMLAGDWVNNTGGAATLTKSGDGKWVLSGDNAYTGLTTVNAGTLQFAKMVALNNNVDTNWTAAKINVKSGATLAVNVDSAGTNGFTDVKLNTLLTNISVANTATEGLQAGAILGFDTSTATGATFTQGNAIADSTGSGSFHGAIGVAKLGTGTLELDKANTYTGTTTVNAGTLLVSGSIGASAVTVSNAGTILATDAAASFGSTVAVNNGAILAAGGAAAAGTATVTGATTFNNGSIFSWDISATGASYDKLIAASLAGEVTPGNAVFQIVVADDTFANGFWNSTQTWTDIFTTNGTTAIVDWADLFTLSVVDSNFDALTLPGGTSFAISGNTLTWTAVPEPTSALAGLLLGAGLLRRRRQGYDGQSCRRC